VARAEETGLPPASTDLVTLTQAAHWLDLAPFYAEACRIARPKALLALISYGVLHVEGPADAHVQAFYAGAMGPYWPPDRRHVESGYRDLPFPFEDVPVPFLTLEAAWCLEELVGYLTTWFAVKAAAAATGSKPPSRHCVRRSATCGGPITAALRQVAPRGPRGPSLQR
jgi:hypothetical protein